MGVISDSGFVEFASVLVALAVCLYYYLTSKFNYWKDRGVAYVEPIPFFGNLKGQIFGTVAIDEMYQSFYDELKGHDFGGFFEFRSPSLIVRNPKLVEKVLIKDFDHFYNRGFTANVELDVLSNNLFNLEDTNWRNLRYKLTPTFTTGKLKGMFDQICNCGGKLLKAIEDETKINKAMETKPLLTTFAFEVIGSVAFGLQMDKDDEATKNFYNVINIMFNPTKLQMIRSLLKIYFPSIAQRFRIKQFTEKLENDVMTLIQAVLKHRIQNNVNRNDFVQLLLNIQKQEKEGTVNFSKDIDFHPEDEVIDQMKYVSKLEDDDSSKTENAFMTDSCIAAQSFIFFTAGSETIGSTVNLSLFCLSQNPKIQERVQTEIDSVLEGSKNQWSYQAVKEMVYLEQCIQETLRLYPVAPLHFRICTKPYKIPGTEVVIEKGTRVIVPAMAIQNDPENYDSPQVFDPDRFKDNNFKPSGTFMPFGDGPRICIAMRFAVLEVKVVLARILSQYKVKLSDKTKLPLVFKKNSFLLAPEGGIYFEFDKRVKA